MTVVKLTEKNHIDMVTVCTRLSHFKERKNSCLCFTRVTQMHGNADKHRSHFRNKSKPDRSMTESFHENHNLDVLANSPDGNEGTCCGEGAHKCCADAHRSLEGPGCLIVVAKQKRRLRNDENTR